MERTSLEGPPWFQNLLVDPSITDLCLNGYEEVFFDRGRGMERFVPADDPWSEGGLKSWVLQQLSQVGKSWDARHPFIDATLASGHRLHAIFQPVSDKGLLLSLRKIAQNVETGEPGRWESSPLFPFLAEAARRGEPLLIAGATGSGKTTLVSDLISGLGPERVLALEDTEELMPRHPHFIRLLSRPANADGFGEVSLRTLLKQALRMRPDRIILGECRGAEVLDLLLALNTGHRGAMATLHANSARDALRRVELLCLLSAGHLGTSTIRELIATGIRWVVFVEREGHIRKIHEIWGIEGREGDTILMRPVVQLDL